MSDRITKTTDYELHMEVHKLMCEVFDSMSRRLSRVKQSPPVVPKEDEKPAECSPLESSEVSECQS